MGRITWLTVVLMNIAAAVACDDGTDQQTAAPTEIDVPTQSVMPTDSSPTIAATPPAGPASPTLPAGIAILAPGGVRAATDLQAEPDCSETELRKGIGRLSWSHAIDTGSEQRVTVSIYRDGFDSGRFDTSTSLEPDASSFVWDRIEPGVIHYWRVLTLQENGWAPSETATFEGLTCVADMAQ